MQAFVASFVTLVLLAGIVLLVTRISRATARLVWLAVFALVVGAGVSMMAAHSFISKWGFRGDSGRDGLFALMDGTGHRPFVYRRLAFDAVRVATDLAVVHAPERVVRYAVEQTPLRRYRSEWGESWTPRKAIAFHLAYVILWASFFGAQLAGAALTYTVRKRSLAEALALSILAMSLVPLIFTNGAYVYDGVELLLWTTLLTIALRGGTLLVVPVFAMMLVNKESALLTVPALIPILARKNGLFSALRWGAVLGAIGVGWVFYVRSRFAANPGQPLEWWFWSNLEFWREPLNYFRFSQLYSPGLVAPRGANLLLLLFVFIPIRFGWSRLPAELRASILIMTGILVPLLLLNCQHDEIRNLSLLFPLLFVAAEEGIYALFQLEGSGEREAVPSLSQEVALPHGQANRDSA